MEYITKGYVFDEEVTTWLNKLKCMHGSYNKGLRLVAFPAEGRGKPAIDVTPQPTRALPAARKKLNKREAAIQARAENDLTAREVGRENIDYSDVESTPTTHVATLDAVSPPPSSQQQGKVSMENWRASRRPLTKPKDRKKE
jgi:hypothetical protein